MTESRQPDRTPPTPRRIEEASINAWPALRQLLLDGWLLRFAGGFTKRANCIAPLYPSEQPLAGKVRYCENLYARERLQTVFRLSSISADQQLDAYLDHRGYQRADPTEVLVLPNAAGTPQYNPAIRLCNREHWLTAYAELTRLPVAAQPLHSAILKAVQTECAYALLERDGVVVACGLGVMEQELIGLFDVFTHPDHRGTGCAHRLVTQLIAWGASRGATTAYLQVSADNAPARALYSRLGFSRCHQYWYRISG